MDDQQWVRLNVKLRIAIIVLLLFIGGSIWYVGLGPSAEKVKLCYSATGIPINQQNGEKKEPYSCISCYDLMMAEAARYVTNDSKVYPGQNHSFDFKLMDNLIVRGVNVSQNKELLGPSVNVS